MSNKEQEIGWKEAFYLLDEDGDGYLSYSEASIVLRSLGYLLTTQDINSIFESVTNNIYISLTDMKKIISLCNKPNTFDFKNRLRASLLGISNENTGKISINRLVKMLTTLDNTLTEDSIIAVLKKRHIDTDYNVNIEDIVNTLIL